MEYINKKQLSFILEIKPEDARAKMCVAWAKSKGIKNNASWVFKKIHDSFPDAMPIRILADGLNIPNLQTMVDDIEKNFLVRPASKKWILCDYPQQMIAKKN